MSYDRPYQGLKVLDTSQGFAGPYIGGILALYGADVIKVEPPGGDWIRQIGRAFDGHTPLGVVANRGKRSVAVDLKSDRGRDIVRQLARDVDVFLESSRPGVAARLGIGYDDIRAVAPCAIYTSVSAFGQSGPDAGRPGTDTVMQANTAFMSVNKGMDGVPHRSGILIADTSGAIFGFQAVAAALFARQQQSEGRFLDINLMQATAAFMGPKIVEYHVEKGDPKPLNAPAGSYRTKDGWIAITLVREEQFPPICQTLGRPELAEDPRYRDFGARADNLESLQAILSGILARHGTEEWVERLERFDVLCSPVADIGDWLKHPQTAAMASAPLLPQPGMGDIPVPVVPGIAPPANPAEAPVAPAIGEHGREILTQAGFDKGDIASLARDRIIRLP